MAGRLYLPFSNPVLDGNGAPRPGAYINVFVNNTTTPVSTYTDIGLTTPHDPDTTADANGVLPAIYVTEHTFYRVRLYDADGVQLDQQDNCPCLGEDFTLFSYDFSPHGRFKIYGTGGYVRIWSGDSAGDDTGGQFRWSGWNGTQGDTGTFDFTTMALTGALTVGATLAVTGETTIETGKYIGLVRLAAGTVSNVTSIDYAFPAGYDRFRIELYGLAPVTDEMALWARASFDNGASYSLGSYGVAGSVAVSVAGALPICPPMDSASGATQQNLIVVEVLRKGLRCLSTAHFLAGAGGSSSEAYYIGGGVHTSNTNLATNIRFLCQSGNISAATYVIFGYKKATVGVTS